MKSRRTFHILCTACLVTLFSLFSFAIPSAVSAADSNRLQKFVDSGRLSSEVRKKIEETGKAEVLLLLNADDIRQDMQNRRKARGLKVLDRQLLQEKKARFSERKNRVFPRFAGKNFKVLWDYGNFPIVFIEADEQVITDLLAMNEVRGIAENGRVEKVLYQSLPLIDAPEAHSLGATGFGTSVAVFDTGVDYTRTAFGACTGADTPEDCTASGVTPSPNCRVTCAHDFAPPDGMRDDDGHGTNVSGIVVGVAPDARILGLDVFSSDGYAYYADLLAAKDWVIANKDTHNIVAVNMSLGGGAYSTYCDGDPLAIGVNQLKEAGISSAISTGNDGYLDSLSTPACASGAISVGAVYDSSFDTSLFSGCQRTDIAIPDKVTCFSNSASFLKLLAPGSFIVAAPPATSPYLGYSGTSQAAPHVAGAIAVIKGEEPSLTPDQVLGSLSANGVPVTDHRNGRVTPRLNLFASVGSLLEPLIGYDPASFSFETIQGGTLPSSQPLSIRNDGTGSLAWSVGADVPWLDLSPASGSDTGSVTVSVNDTSLSAGSYNATITITSADAANSPRVLPVTLVLHGSEFTEDFETGGLTYLPWTFDGILPWFVQNDTVYGGQYAAETPAILDDQVSDLEVLLNVTSPGFVQFKIKAYTESSANNMRFRIDGVSYGKSDGWYGDTGWIDGISTIEVQPGIHLFTWRYRQGNPSTLPGEAVWLDDIVFPPFNADFPDISILPTYFNFGSVPTGNSSAPRTFIVSNNGDSDLVIGNVSLPTIFAGNTQFRIQSDTCSGQTIAPAGDCTLQVIYEPFIAGITTGEFWVESNDYDTPILKVGISGTGIQYWTLTAAKDGTGDGTVTSSPAGISCGTDCSQSYTADQAVTLSASPDGNSSFTGWSGGGCSGTGTCVVTMTGDLTVTATFTMLPPVAAFSGSPASGSAPLIVAFTDSSTNFPTSWAWDFGDGGTSVAQNPLHLYEQPGNYAVSLTAANGSGADDEMKTSYITAGTCPNPPVAIGVVYYETITEAYADPLTDTGDVLGLHGISFTGDLVFGRDIDVVLSGGHNCEYTASAMGSKLSGSLTVSAGTVTVENLIIM